MTLPGKLTIGFLHEDNPLKSFFRMKPLLTEEADGLKPSDKDDRFPEEGFIRIVPDKNEITIFKNRMRQMGRYCALDLRKHLSENDKIRPNKNYIPGGPERNANIVYSDVIGRLPMHMIAEVVECDQDPNQQMLVLDMELLPGTAYVLLRHKGELWGPWGWASGEENPLHVTLTRAVGQPFSHQSERKFAGSILPVPVDDTQALLLYDLTPFGLNEVAMPEIERPMERTPIEAMPQSTSQLLGLAPTPDSFRQSEPEPDRMAQFGYRDPSYQEYSAARARSLHEVVEEQWRKSRYDQLGQSAPGQTIGRPAQNPVEHAIASLTEVWSRDESRPALIAELLRNEEIRDTLTGYLAPRAGLASGEMNRQMNELEAARLKLIGEIDALRLKRDETKSLLMDELRAQNRQELAQFDQKSKALTREIDRNERAAQSAGKAAEQAQKLLNESVDKLDERLMSSLLGMRMMELARRADVPKLAGHPETHDPMAGELISDMRVQLEQAGFPLSNDQAVNLLACLMAGGTLILSGASGTGKSELSRRLADALGLSGKAGRFVEARTPSEPAVQQLLQQDDRLTKLMLLLDDVNTGDCKQTVTDVLRLQEMAAAKDIPLNLVLTAQDAPDGEQLPVRLLSRSFVVRLDKTPFSAPWKPAEIVIPAPTRAVSLSALHKIFNKNQELPGELTDRLNKLRKDLARFSYSIDRRTLNELWNLCACSRGLMQCSNLELLDLALSQRALPHMMATLGLEALRELPALLSDMPRCLSLMRQPMPLL